MSWEEGNYGSELWPAFPSVSLLGHEPIDEHEVCILFKGVRNYGPVYGSAFPTCLTPPYMYLDSDSNCRRWPCMDLREYGSPSSYLLVG